MKIEKIIIGLIIISGVFYYSLSNAVDMFYPSQFALFIFAAGVLASYLLYKKHKLIGLLFALCSLGFVKTYLLQHAPQEFLFKTSLFGCAVFFIYYFTRQLEFKEDILKWFLIPACVNIVIVIIQKFDHNFLSFLPVRDTITGLLGNRGITACYLVMTLPLFLKYFKKGIPFLLLALFFSSVFAFILSLSMLAIYYFLKGYGYRKTLICAFLLVSIITVFAFKGKVYNSMKMRTATTVGILDGIKHNPVLGWGLGSFEPVMIKASQKGLTYLGVTFNHGAEIMGHPHNEVLLGWWNFGILFPILTIFLIIDFIKRYTKENIIPFLIVLTGGITSLFYFISPPAWLLLMVTLGIYHNQFENKEVAKCQ